MTDIKERLRKLRDREIELGQSCDQQPEFTANYKYAEWLHEAADHIAAQEKRIAELEALNLQLHCAIHAKTCGVAFNEDHSEVFIDGFGLIPIGTIDTWKEIAAPSDTVDAERYRWLRDSDNQKSEDDICVSDSFFITYFGNELDAAIDAMKAAK